MNIPFTVKITFYSALFLCFTALPYSKDFAEYKNSTDSIHGTVKVDKKLHSEFFDSNETSYRWYIHQKEDGTYESALSTEITREEKVPVEHTSNCISTHQGRHKMNFCLAKLGAGSLRLEIYGGLPAFASSLMIEVKGTKFNCFFKAVYPAPVENLKWKILSKELVLKSLDFKKEERFFARISIEFEETSTFQKKNIKRNYKIDGYLKPVIH